MAGIPITCPSCSATLRLANPVPPGKRIKCPKCGEAFVPVDADDADEAPAPPPRKAPAAAVKKAAPAAVKKAAPVARPRPDDEDEPPRQPVKKAARARDDDEDDDRPRKKKREGDSPLLLIGVGLMTLLIVVAVAGYVLWKRGMFGDTSAEAKDTSKGGPQPGFDPKNPGGFDPKNPGGFDPKKPGGFDPKGGPPFGPGDGKQGGWQVADLKDLRCKVEFPAAPMKYDLGGKGLYVAASTTETCSVALRDVPNEGGPTDPKAVLKREVENFTTINAKKDVTLKGGYPGVDVVRDTEFNGNQPQKVEFVRMYVVGNRLYTLAVLCRRGQTDRTNVDRFFNSFQVSE